jgi:site-specific DNA-methyltransferase (adenine-specific)
MDFANLPAQNKIYYKDDAAVIYCADNREILPLFPDKAFDLVLTDPPYGVEFDGTNWDKTLVWFEMSRRLTDLTLFTPGIINIWDFPKADWVICWLKEGSTRRNITGGFNWWEPVLQYGKNKWMIDLIKLPSISNIAGSLAGEHPCPKPLNLFSRIIENTTKPADLILDPFLGSGTTAVAAKILGRKCIGIEISEKYCEIAAKRLSQSVMQLEIPKEEVKQSKF